MIRPAISCLVLSTLCIPTVDAQAFDNWETEFDSALTLVAALSGDEEAEDVLGEVSLGLRSTRVLENGAEIGLRLAVRAQRDHPARPAGAGVIFADPAQTGGGMTGLQVGPDDFDTGPRAALELAYAYLDGGYGELTLGRDTGVAQRFSEGGDSLFRLARVDAAALDVSGRSLVRTSDAVSGTSFKVSYATPRFLGLRAGISVTPDASENEGLDRAPGRITGSSTGIVPDQGVELGLNGSRVIGRDGPRIDVGLTWSRYETSTTGPLAGLVQAEPVETWSAGVRGELGDVVAGLAWLSSNDGVGGQTYEARSATLTYALTPDWQIGGEWGAADFAQGDVDSESWSVGARRAFGDTLVVAAGWRADSLVVPVRPVEDFSGIVIEITLRP